MAVNSLSAEFSAEYIGAYTSFSIIAIITDVSTPTAPTFISAYSTTLENGAWVNYQQTPDWITDDSGLTLFTPDRTISSTAQVAMAERIDGEDGVPTISILWPLAIGATYSGYAVGDVWKIHYTLQDFDAYMISAIHHERTTDLIYTDATDGSVKFFNLDGEPNADGRYTEVQVEDVTGSEGDTPSKPTDMDVYNKNVFIGYGPESEPMVTRYVRAPGGKGAYELKPLEIRAPKTANSPEESIDKVIDSNLEWLPEGGTEGVDEEDMFIGISVSGTKIYAISKSSSTILASDDIPFQISSIAPAYRYNWENNAEVTSIDIIYVASYTSLRIAEVELNIVDGELEATIRKEISVSPKYDTAYFPEGALIGDIATYKKNTGITWHDGSSETDAYLPEDVIMVISAFKETGFGEGECQIFTGSIAEMENEGQSGSSMLYTLELLDRSIPNNKCSLIKPGHYKSYHWWGEVKSNDRHKLYIDTERVNFKDTKDWDGAFYNYLDLTTKAKNNDGTYSGETVVVTINAYSSSGDWWQSAIGGLLEIVFTGLAYAWLICGGFAVLSAYVAAGAVVGAAVPTLGQFILGEGVVATIGVLIDNAGEHINKYMQSLTPTTGADVYFPLGFDPGWYSTVSIYLPRLGLTIIEDLDGDDTTLFEPYVGVIAHSDAKWVKFGGVAQYQDDYSGVVDLHAIASAANGKVAPVDSFLYTFNNMEWSEDYFAASGTLTAGYTLERLTQIGPTGPDEADKTEFDAASGEYLVDDEPIDTYWFNMSALSKLSPQYNTWDGSPRMSLTKAIFPLPLDISQEEIVQCAVLAASFTSVYSSKADQVLDIIDATPTAGSTILVVNDAEAVALKIAISTQDDDNDAAELYIFELQKEDNISSIRSEFNTKFVKTTPSTATMELGGTATAATTLENMQSTFDSGETEIYTGTDYNYIATARGIDRPLLFPLISSTSPGNEMGIFSSQNLGYHIYSPTIADDATDGTQTYPIQGQWGQSVYTSMDSQSASEVGFFQEGSEYKYKIAYLYEGSYISPLGKGAWSHHVAEQTDGVAVTVVINKPDPRVTHVLVYRKDPNTGAYAEAASIKLGRFNQIPTPEGAPIQLTCTVIDDGDVLGTFSGDTGLSELAKRPIVYYEQSTVLGGVLFAVNISTPGNPHDDMSHVICSSKPNNFHIFDWANDIAILPNIPTAIAAFNGRIYVWDDVNTYRINPDTRFIEDTYNGVGCFGRNAFVVTEYGMCFADHNNIYLHDGSKPVAIGAPILTSLESSDFKGWQELEKTGIKIGYDATINSYVIFVTYVDKEAEPTFNAIDTEVTYYSYINTDTITDISDYIVASSTTYTFTNTYGDDGLINTDIDTMVFTNDAGTEFSPTDITYDAGETIATVTITGTVTAGDASVTYEYTHTAQEPPGGEGITYTTETITESLVTSVDTLGEGTFIYNRLSGSWTFSDRLDEYGNPAPISTITQGPLGEIYMAEPTAIKVFAKSTTATKLWTWESKELDFDVANVNKKFSKIYIRGKGLSSAQENFKVFVDGVSVTFDIDIKDNVIELEKFGVKKGMTIQVKLINQTGSLEAISFSGKPKRVK